MSLFEGERKNFFDKGWEKFSRSFLISIEKLNTMWVNLIDGKSTKFLLIDKISLIYSNYLEWKYFVSTCCNFLIWLFWPEKMVCNLNFTFLDRIINVEKDEVNEWTISQAWAPKKWTNWYLIFAHKRFFGIFDPKWDGLNP